LHAGTLCSLRVLSANRTVWHSEKQLCGMADDVRAYFLRRNASICWSASWRTKAAAAPKLVFIIILPAILISKYKQYLNILIVFSVENKYFLYWLSCLISRLLDIVLFVKSKVKYSLHEH
jgi:hypothetical protein